MAQAYEHTQKGHRLMIFGLLAGIFALSRDRLPRCGIDLAVEARSEHPWSGYVARGIDTRPTPITIDNIERSEIREPINPDLSKWLK